MTPGCGSFALGDARVLLVGLGGLGCPVALGLVRAGVGLLRIADDDQVDLSNLHRQILYQESDVGADKLAAGVRALRELVPGSPTRIEPVSHRILPDNAQALVREVDLVVEGADNFATKFLVADACRLEARPVVQGAAVRWVTTAMCAGPNGRPCYRCLFEDIPRGREAPNCAEAGVMGPVVGFGAALMVELALEALQGKGFGTVASYDGLSDRLRSIAVTARADCSLCGEHPQIIDTQWSRYRDE